MMFFCNKSAPIANMSGGRYVQPVLEGQGHRAELHFKGMSTPMSFEVLIFIDSLSVLHKAVRENKQKVTQSYMNGTPISWCVQLVTKA